MSDTTPELQPLTEEQTETLRRFVGVLSDMGVQAHMSEFVLQTSEYSEFALRNFGQTIQDVASNSPEEMYKSGPSLVMVVEVARATQLFPGDFLPSEATVDACLENFWASKR